jgi:hypothetical protein
MTSGILYSRPFDRSTVTTHGAGWKPTPEAGQTLIGMGASFVLFDATGDHLVISPSPKDWHSAGMEPDAAGAADIPANDQGLSRSWLAA